MSSAETKANRPVSPHIQIYHWHLTMVMSIFHRATGIALYVGMALLAWWLLAAATGRGAFVFINGLLGSWVGLVVLFGLTWSLLHHMLGGLRHFIWDTGRGLGKPARDQLALATIVGSGVLTVIVWIIGVAVA
ncbi:succinate dehydrogenase, cytochrome b556 subunit [Bauldia sp.]|uniref:succinate dehydrogenase, cytochrome b556 subunit n=1 Tax=Bauldia sp. TaxID=2575872 RepID=UPI003BA97307